jgi:hypothetical protein
MAARLSDRVTYAYCSGCGGLLIGARQAQFRSEELFPGRFRIDIWHAWCAVTTTWVSRQGQCDRRN